MIRPNSTLNSQPIELSSYTRIKKFRGYVFLKGNQYIFYVSILMTIHLFLEGMYITRRHIKVLFAFHRRYRKRLVKFTMATNRLLIAAADPAYAWGEFRGFYLLVFS